MRCLRTVLLAAALTPAGCEWMRNSRDKDVIPRPGAPVPKVQPEQLVNYLNQQAATLRTVEYSDVVLSATENGRDYPTLRDCKLAAARPRNFRLVCGTLVTSQELDLGSNDREFWVYAKRLDGPNYFFCSHEDYTKRAVNFPVPFDPDWVMMALGMSPYDPNARYTVEADERRQVYWLRQETTTRQGQPVTKTTAFNVDYQRGRRPVVRGHQILDANKAVVCTADVRAVKTIPLGPDPAGGEKKFIQVPTRVVLEWPQQKFVMDLELRGEAVNEDLSDRAAVLFARPQIRGTNPIDLAKYQFPQPSGYRGQAPGETRGRRR
jgi:hypothetical protein